MSINTLSYYIKICFNIKVAFIISDIISNYQLQVLTNFMKRLQADRPSPPPYLKWLPRKVKRQGTLLSRQKMQLCQIRNIGYIPW